MFWQYEYEREGVAMTLNNTYQLDLPKSGLLGSLLLRFSGSDVSGLGTTGGEWRLLDFISKIEVMLDTSTPCKSITGKQAAALQVYDQGHIGPSAWRNYASNTQFEYLLINFGRWLHDPNVGIDLARYNNVKLQITNDAAAADLSDISVSVLKVLLRDAPSSNFLGYLRTEEWRRWTTVQAETIYSELPTEHRLRRIGLFAQPPVDGSNVEGTGMANLMEDIDLSLDTGQIRVYKGGIDDLMRLNGFDLWGSLITGGQWYGNVDVGFDVGLGYVEAGAWGSGSADGAVSTTVPTLESGRTSFTQKAESFEADSPINFLMKGQAPHNLAMYRFDPDPDPATWLDPNARKTVKLDIKTRDASSAAGGTNAIVLDRFVRY